MKRYLSGLLLIVCVLGNPTFVRSQQKTLGIEFNNHYFCYFFEKPNLNKQNFNFFSELLFDVNFTKSMTLKVGIGYYNKNYYQKNEIAPLFPNSVIKETFSYSYISLPLSYEFHFRIFRKWSLSPGAGISTDFLISKSHEKILYNSASESGFSSEDEFDNLKLFLNANLGCNYALSPSWTIGLETLLKYDLNINNYYYNHPHYPEYRNRFIFGAGISIIFNFDF